MSIIFDNINIGDVKYGSQNINSIYYGSILVWSAGVTPIINGTFDVYVGDTINYYTQESMTNYVWSITGGTFKIY